LSPARLAGPTVEPGKTPSETTNAYRTQSVRNCVPNQGDEMHTAASCSSQETIETFQQFVIPNYTRYPVCLVHGDGSYVWEAVEGAIKLARLHGSAAGRYKIITFENGFHGRTYAAVTATAQPKYHEGLGPLVPGFMYAPLDNLDAVAKLVDKETCAILIEPI